MSSASHTWQRANSLCVSHLFLSSLPAPAGLQEHPKTGQLALYLLVLRAACQEAERQLVTQLKLYLHKEKNNIGKTTYCGERGAGSGFTPLGLPPLL